jgi:hypothetical protein
MRLAVLAILLPTLALASTIKDDLGVTALQQALGDKAPTGQGVPVTIVESGGVPDPAAFPGKNLVIRDGTTKFTSHAYYVGAGFFGTAKSRNAIGVGVMDIDAFNTARWQAADILVPGTGQPRVSPNASRVANHSYQYREVPQSMANQLRRMDWLVEHDDFIQITGNTGDGTVPPLGVAMNLISVAPASARGPRQGTAGLGDDAVYTAGRFKPDLCGPADASNAAGWTSGIATLLIQTGHENPKLSRDRSYKSPRTGTTIYHAETSEVIKAALMAGAMRNFKNANPHDGSQVSDWGEGLIPTIRPTTQPATTQSTTKPVETVSAITPNGLDRRYGAGQPHTYNSYRILAAGIADAGEKVGDAGFSYAAKFGRDQRSATYHFTPTVAGKLAVCLAWNAKIAGGTPESFDGTATLYDLNLQLTDGQIIVGESKSKIDNTENLWANVIAGRTYELTVTAEGEPFDWDYGLAWLVMPE